MKKILAFALSAAMMLALCACGGKDEPPVESEPDPYAPVKMDWKDVDGDGVIRVACIGDSITQGTPESNWPDFLQSELNILAHEDGNVYEVRNHGKAGAAVRHYLENYPELDTDGDGMAYFYYDDEKYTSALTYTPDVVIVQFGSNDGLGGNAEQLETYFKNDYYTYLVKPFLDKGSFVAVATPPHAANGFVDEPVNGRISEMVREMARDYNLGLVDINKITDNHAESFPDGIHGNASGYSLISLTYYNQIFGGKVRTLTLDAGDAHGATITVDGLSITSGGEKRDISLLTHSGDDGKCLPILMLDDGIENTLSLKATCENFKNYTETFSVNGSSERKITLTPGQFNVTGTNATATADSATMDSKGYLNEAQMAVDGNPDTRWESGYHNNAWLLVDLGSVKNINGVNIKWEGAYSSNYSILVSTDGENFTNVADVNLNHEGEEITTFDPVDVRYVKIDCKTRATFFGHSIWELKVLSDTMQ